MIRGFDVRSGSELWRFNSLPLTGGLGSETWEEGSLVEAGGANNWTGMALDEERGMVVCANRLGHTWIFMGLHARATICLPIVWWPWMHAAVSTVGTHQNRTS